MGWFIDGNNACWETIDRNPGDYESITVTDVATGLSSLKVRPMAGNYANCKARGALLSLEDADLRVRLDGGLPTSMDGHYLSQGAVITVLGTQALDQLRVIKAGTGDGKLRVTYFY
jgi:hypothetical protein